MAPETLSIEVRFPLRARLASAAGCALMRLAARLISYAINGLRVGGKPVQLPRVSVDVDVRFAERDAAKLRKLVGAKP